MEQKTFTIPNISCGHCVRAIQQELTNISGVKEIQGNPDKKTITVTWEAPADETQLMNVLKEINYPVI